MAKQTDSKPAPKAAAAAKKAESPVVKKPSYGSSCVKISGHTVESVVPTIKSA